MLNFGRFIALLLLSACALAHADPTDLSKTIAIRSKMLECSAVWSKQEPNTRGHDHVGVPISTGGPEQFRESIAQIIKDYGTADFIGSSVYVGGVVMGNEAATEAQYREVLTSAGIGPNDVKIIILSAPQSKITGEAVRTLKGVFDNFRYFFLNGTRDYETPMSQAVIADLVSTIPIEIPNVVYLYHSLPTTDATLVIGTHALTLGLYAYYGKTLINWLLRPGTNRMELFLKQCMMSMPFILNYKILGNSTAIWQKIQTEGWQAVAAQGPHAVAQFIASDGFSTVLQTVFYSTVITGRVGSWIASKPTEELQRGAMTSASVMKAPILALDALLLGYATTSNNILFDIGPVHINDGHAMLAGITILGYLAYNPKVLDNFGLKPYFFTKELLQRIRTTWMLNNPFKNRRRRN